MRIVILEDLLETIRKSLSAKRRSIPLYGRMYPDENLCQIWSLEKRPDLEETGTARKQKDRIYLHIAGQKIPINNLEAISYQYEYSRRAEGLVDTDLLSQKIVALVGLGSIGSALAVYLAQISVGRFKLVDMDRLSAANVSRHACDLEYLGRFKTKAVKDLILNRNPRARVENFEEDFLALSFEARADRLAKADLIIASTDSNECQFAVNEVCLDLGLPSLYVGCYERAQAGEVFYVIPGLTPCFNCAMEFRFSASAEMQTRDRRIPYSDENSANGFQAEPGLAIDIGYVSAVAAGYGLALLAPDGRRRTLLDLKRNLILLHGGTKPGKDYRGLFTGPFDLIRARIKRDRPCEICQTLHIEGRKNGTSTAQFS